MIISHADVVCYLWKAQKHTVNARTLLFPNETSRISVSVKSTVHGRELSSGYPVIPVQTYGTILNWISTLHKNRFARLIATFCTSSVHLSKAVETGWIRFANTTREIFLEIFLAWVLIGKLKFTETKYCADTKSVWCIATTAVQLNWIQTLIYLKDFCRTTNLSQTYKSNIQYATVQPVVHPIKLHNGQKTVQ